MDLFARKKTSGLLRGCVVAAFLLTAHADQVLAHEKPTKPGVIAPKKKAKTQIQWLIQPKSVEIYFDGRRLGTAAEVKLTTTKPGRHSVRLVNGKDETEFDLELRKNQTLRFEFTFES